MWWRCLGSTPCAAAFSTYIPRRQIVRSGSSSLATRSSLSASSTLEHSVRRIRSMKRFSGKRITGAEEIVEQAVRSAGVTVFPGWEFYAPVAGADRTVFDLMPRAVVLADEPDNLRNEFERVWSRIEDAHERSEVGNLVRPTDLYVPPEEWWARLATLPGAEVEHLEIARPGRTNSASFRSQPA